MRLTLQIDGMRHEIDSTDPETLGRWMVEILARVTHPTPATLIQMQAWASWLPDDSPQGGHPDWIADTRYTGNLATVSTPRDIVNALAAWVDEYERKDS